MGAYRGPYFGVFDTLKEKNPWKKDKGAIGLLSKFAIAQTTAIIAGFISYPFDTVRRRLQMQSEKPKEQCSTRARSIAPSRSSRTRVLPLCSRDSAPTCSAP